jgi:hypothetical protein
MRTTRHPLILVGLAGFAALVALAAAPAQDRDRPLGDLLDALPADDDAEAPGEVEGEKPAPPAERPFAPLLRPPPPSSRPAPPPPAAPEPGRIGTLELPPSAFLYREDDPPPAPPDPPGESAPGEAVRLAPPPPPPPPPTEADLAWEAMQEQRRREINAVEGPEVARLNEKVAADREAARLRDEQARADYERALLEREVEAARIEADHRAAVEAYRRAVARQRAEYEARVAACLAGDRAACAPR